jgi:chitinase
MLVISKEGTMTVSLTRKKIAAMFALVVLLLSLMVATRPSISPIHALAPAWAPNTAYAVNQLASYGGSDYKCLQAHTSLTGWEPPNVPALWQLQAGGGATNTPTKTATANGPTNTPTKTATAGGPTNTPTKTATTGGPTNTPTKTATSSTPPTATTGTCQTNCTVPKHALVGYWHNFDNGSGNIKLRNVSTKWDVINVSFGEPTSVTSGDIRFTPYNDTVAGFQSDVAYLKSIGKKVILSIGGANGQVQLTTTGARDTFVNSVKGIINLYGMNGLDIDFEGHSLFLNAGDKNINAPTTPVLVNLIAALRSLKSQLGSSFMITMAPETFFVQLGYSFYGGTCSGCDTRAGSYLPVIQAMRNDGSLNWLQVQNYNSGSITGLDGQYHSMGGADFHIAMLDMLLAGFTVAGTGQTFAALSPSQVVVGVPANANAGGGYVPMSVLKTAIDCVVKHVSCGGYAPRSASATAFRGVMSWSVNWDQFNNFDLTNTMRPYLDALP